MALYNRRTFSEEPSNIRLTGNLSSNEEDMGDYYRNYRKLSIDNPDGPALEYLDHHALPADRPVGHPHLINMDVYGRETQKQDLRITDGVVTVLYRWEPEALAAFLDNDLNNFRFRVTEEIEHPHNFYVERTRKRVKAG